MPRASRPARAPEARPARTALPAPAAALPATVRELRRGQIVAAARALVAEEGLEALTIGALEQRLGYSRGVITYHFAGKDEVVRAVLESAVAEIDAGSAAEVAASAAPAERIRAVIHANVRGFVDRPEAGRVLLSFWSRLAADEGIRALNAELYRTYRRRTARLVGEGQDAGAFRDDVDPDRIAAVVVGLVLGIATQWYFDPSAIDVEDAVAEAAAAVVARLAPPRRR